MRLQFLNNPKEVKVKTSAEEELVVIAFFKADNEEKNIDISLIPGRGSRIYFFSSCLLRGKSRLVIRSKQLHSEEGGFSDLLCKAVVKDSGFFDYTGRVIIDRHGQKSYAYQRNENLILSEEGRVSSEPKLEILADEVFCTHGATTSYLDDEELFYLQTRGLPRKKIEDLLAKGFLLSGLDKLVALSVPLKQIEALSRRLEAAIN